MKYLSQQGQLAETDISGEMISQFEKKCADFPNAKIVHAMVDQPYLYDCIRCGVF